MAEVDNTASAGAKEDGTVQPALAVRERAPNQQLVLRKIDERKIPARFEKSNVLAPHDPTFDIVSQEKKIVAMKRYGGLAFRALRSGSRWPFGFVLDCRYKRRGTIEIDGKWRCGTVISLSSPRQSGEHLINRAGR